MEDIIPLFVKTLIIVKKNKINKVVTYMEFGI